MVRVGKIVGEACNKHFDRSDDFAYPTPVDVFRKIFR